MDADSADPPAQPLADGAGKPSPARSVPARINPVQINPVQIKVREFATVAERDRAERQTAQQFLLWVRRLQALREDDRRRQG